MNLMILKVTPTLTLTAREQPLANQNAFWSHARISRPPRFPRLPQIQCARATRLYASIH